MTDKPGYQSFQLPVNGTSIFGKIPVQPHKREQMLHAGSEGGGGSDGPPLWRGGTRRLLSA